jgi:hypothetical protein
MSDKAIKAAPPALPAVLDDWVSRLKGKRTINDLVQDMHQTLLNSSESDSYIAFLTAVYDEQAVEGSLAADNIEAARMIRDRARTVDGNSLQHEKLATIAKSLGIVLRRYHLSRKERRQQVNGQPVPGNSGD